MKTLCQQHPGMCAGDPACSDRLCPGHPCQRAAHPLHHLEQAESAARASRQFRPDFGIEGPHFRLSLLQRRRVRAAVDILACLAVILIVLVVAFHQINLANLFR